MEKPPFQFGLKVIFAVMTGAAMLMAGCMAPTIAARIGGAAFLMYFMVLTFVLVSSTIQYLRHRVKRLVSFRNQPPGA